MRGPRSQIVISHDEGTTGHLHAKGEQLSRQRVSTEVGRQSRGDLAEPEMKMRGRGKEDQSGLPRSVSSGTDARGRALKFAMPTVMRIP